MIALSVVAPVYQEAAILRELADRCAAAAGAAAPTWEVILVDDGSTDGTRELAPSLPRGVELHSLAANVGQIRATQAGLKRARGSIIAVLDGDLQDPPELIPELFRALSEAPPAIDVVFATKVSRRDPAWFLVGRAGFELLQRVAAVSAVPTGVGSYCVMRRDLAQRAARAALRDANLASVLVALGARCSAVPYDRAERYDGVSRVGAIGLAREALGSLLLTGALTRLSTAGAALLAIGAARSGGSGARWASGLSAVALAGIAFAAEAQRREMLSDAAGGAAGSAYNSGRNDGVDA